MRFAFVFLFCIFAAAAPGTPAVPDLRDDEIIRVDPAARVLVIGAGSAAPRSYRCPETATVTLDEKPATFEQLAPGMIAVVTATAPGVASRVAAITPKKAGPAAAAPLYEKRITVSAKSLPRNPVVIGGLRGGQWVTIESPSVRWTSGGAKAGKFCDWNGYPGDRINGIPRMALVAAVGQSIFLPAGETFRFTVATEGAFVLFANDDDPDGNDGFAEVTVTIGWR